MRLAVSNIAWANEDWVDVCMEMFSNGILSYEIVPAKTLFVPPFFVSSFQAIFYGYDAPVSLTDSEEYFQNVLERIRSIRAQYPLVAPGVPVVYGAPGTRLKTKGSRDLVLERLRRLATNCGENSLTLALEPLGKEHDVWFADYHEIEEIVERPMVYHVDTYALESRGVDVCEVISNKLGHFHVSSLDDLEKHKQYAKRLESCGYDGAVVLEAKPNIPLDELFASIRKFAEVYGGETRRHYSSYWRNDLGIGESVRNPS